MRTAPKISIVIVNWNTCDLLRDCIISIEGNGQDFEVEIIVVDNCSTDGSAGMCELNFPNARLICNDNNLGFARANNIAIREAAGEYVMLLNPDTRLAPGLLSGLAKHLDENKKVGIAGPKILERDGKTQGSARRFPSLRTAFFGRTSFLQNLFTKSGAARDEIPCLSHEGTGPLAVDWVSGACMIVRREVFEQAGPLDERYFMYWEDADLCFQARAKGWEVDWVPSVELLHLTGSASRSKPAAIVKTTVVFHRSVFYYFMKNLRPSAPVAALVFVLVNARMLMKLTAGLIRRK